MLQVFTILAAFESAFENHSCSFVPDPKGIFLMVVVDSRHESIILKISRGESDVLDQDPICLIAATCSIVLGLQRAS